MGSERILVEGKGVVSIEVQYCFCGWRGRGGKDQRIKKKLASRHALLSWARASSGEGCDLSCCLGQPSDEA